MNPAQSIVDLEKDIMLGTDQVKGKFPVKIIPYMSGDSSKKTQNWIDFYYNRSLSL